MALVLAVALVLGAPSAQATIQYVDDGAVPNAQGGFDLPTQGQCWGDGAYDATKKTRAACIAQRLPYATAALCTAGTSPTVRSWSTGACNDLVNTTQATCEAQPDRLWNAGTSTCAVVMLYDDRNDVTCALHGGTWITSGVCTGTWVMPARTAYTPNLLTGNGAGDQCLRCHNSRTQYNSPRVRDTEDTMFMGHKNMARKVTVGQGWGGPEFTCTFAAFTTEESCYDNGGNWVPKTFYPSDDSGNAFNWTLGSINVLGVDRAVTWIYGDWLGPMPRAIYKTDPSTSQTCSLPQYTSANCVANGGVLINNAGASYSCGRCHTTGWTSDATIQNAAGIEGKEPETSFPGITWDRNSNAGFGVVNLSGGISNDPKKYSSWDVWGISCSRCHTSVIDTANPVSGSSPTQYNAPTGMSTHHSNMTAADNNSGVCSDTRFTALTQCTNAGGQWLTACSVNPTAAVCTMASNDSATCGTNGGTWVAAPGWCSNAFFTTQATCTANGTCSNALYSTSTTCTANGGTWTAYAWQEGWCTTADAQAACTGGTGTTAKTWRLNGTQASCQAASATWSFSKCSVAGVCNKGAAYTDAASCETAGGQWRFATDIIRCDDAGGRWTGNNTNRGQMITRLCMDCHRQETAGLPNGATSTDGVTVNYAAAFPSKDLKVGQYHSTVAFVSHPHGNQFLNSPHGLFSPTATFDKIATGKLKFSAPFTIDPTSEYTSYFQTEAEAAGTGNGCTGCHEVHTSTVTGEDPFREECTGCHAGAYKKDLTKINHVWGKGTPMADALADESSACESCHMPEGMHLFRINPNPSYSTFPPALAVADTSAKCTALGGTWSATSGCSNVNANVEAEGTYANAVWVDVDLACGQCHGGGLSQAKSTGTIATGSKTLTVANGAGFIAGERIRIADAGSFTYEDSGPVRGDFDSYITTVSGNTLTLVGTAPIGVTDAEVVQNATPLIEPGRYIPWFSKAALAKIAKGMHEVAGTTYPVTFTTSIDPTNSLRVNVDAFVDCGGTCPPTLTYDWNWGDNTAHGTADPDTHLYGAAGTYSITLIVKDGGLQVGSVTNSVTVTAVDNPPVVGGACTWFPDTWTMRVVDSSTDESPATLQIVVDWGDGSTKSFGTQGSTIEKAYGNTGTFTVTQRAIDSMLQTSVRTCDPLKATPTYFTIGGKVFALNGTTPVAGAVVTLKKGTASLSSVYSGSDGSYSFPNLRPGTYKIYVSRAGFKFALPARADVTVGPTKPTGQDVIAIPPTSAAQRETSPTTSSSGHRRLGR